MIKVVSFDIGGTLLLNNSINNYALSKLYEIIDIDKTIVRESYKEIFQKTKGSKSSLIDKFCNRLNIKKTNELVNFFDEKFKSENNISVLNKDALEVMKALKKMNIKIILFSNNCCLIEEKFNNDILKYVDDIIYSYDYGLTKDDEEFYRIIERKLNCNPCEILHIGDTLKSDYIMPKKCGWNALYYGNTTDEDIVCIDSLNKIMDYVMR